MQFTIFLIAAFAAAAIAVKPKHPECKPCWSTYSRCHDNCYLIHFPPDGVKKCQYNCRKEAYNLLPVCKTQACRTS